MKTYGQFCSIAKALEIVGERWTPLIMRELICGGSRFNEIHRGVPRISPSLLSKRLNFLEQAGIVKRVEETGGYQLTPAGWELKPVIEMLGVWGQRWVRGGSATTISTPTFLCGILDGASIWRNFRDFGFAFALSSPTFRATRRFIRLVCRADSVGLCITEPGFDIDLFITTDVRTMTRVWKGALC